MAPGVADGMMDGMTRPLCTSSSPIFDPRTSPWLALFALVLGCSTLDSRDPDSSAPPAPQPAQAPVDTQTARPEASPAEQRTLSGEPESKPIEKPATQWVESGHFHRANRNSSTVDAIAIHTTESVWRPGSTHEQNQRRAYYGVVNYFRNNNRNVSAHFVVGPGGEITQMVREEDAAHTTTYYNDRSFGIECAGWSAREKTWTPELLDSLVELCAYLCRKWDIPAVHPTGTAYESEHAVATDNPKRPRFNAPGIVGHFQVQPWNKTDPGEHFPWDEFMQRLRARLAED